MDAYVKFDNFQLTSDLPKRFEAFFDVDISISHRPLVETCLKDFSFSDVQLNFCHLSNFWTIFFPKLLQFQMLYLIKIRIYINWTIGKKCLYTLENLIKNTGYDIWNTKSKDKKYYFFFAFSQTRSNVAETKKNST